MQIIMVFFFNDTATTEIYTLSLHDALPIFNPYTEHFYVNPKTDPYGVAPGTDFHWTRIHAVGGRTITWGRVALRDRKSTRLNSSHANISYAVFCLKKKTSRSSLLFYYICSK